MWERIRRGDKQPGLQGKVRNVVPEWSQSQVMKVGMGICLGVQKVAAKYADVGRTHHMILFRMPAARPSERPCKLS